MILKKEKKMIINFKITEVYCSCLCLPVDSAIMCQCGVGDILIRINKELARDVFT